MIFAKRITSALNIILRGLVTKADQAKEAELKLIKCLPKLRESFQEDEQNEIVVPVFKKSLLYTDQIAIKDAVNEYTYFQLYSGAKKLSFQISNICGSGASCHVVTLCSNNALFPLIQWGSWISGQVVVPLFNTLPIETMKYIIDDSKTKLLISAADNENMAKNLADEFDTPLIVIDPNFFPAHNSTHPLKQKLILMTRDKVVIEGVCSNDFYTESNAMVLYGTKCDETPKGCIISHQNLDARIRNLTNVWQYKQNDCVLNLLPFEYINGSVHILMSPLSAGGKIILNDKTNTHDVWSNILGINKPTKDRANVLMAMPSTYESLIAEYEKIFLKDPRMVEYIKHYCINNYRLMICGPELLSLTIFNRWKEITGHSLLRYYEMAETGLALSNPYMETGPLKRHSNTIGVPLPQTKIRLINSANEVMLDCDGEVCQNSRDIASQLLDESPIMGELQIAGPNVFKGYLNSVENDHFFTNDYFKTGEFVAYENGVFKILAQSTNDVIKTEGKRVSSLEIESILKTHPKVKDAAIVGLPNVLWSDKICAVCVLKPNSNLDLKDLQLFCSKWLPNYMWPAMLQIVKNIHRNSVGKIDRALLKKLYFTS